MITHLHVFFQKLLPTVDLIMVVEQVLSTLMKYSV